MVLTPRRVLSAAASALFFASALAPGQEVAHPEARLGAIRGRVDVRRELSPVEPRPSVAELGRGPARDRPDRRRSVVYLETAPQGAFEDQERTRAVLLWLQDVLRATHATAGGLCRTISGMLVWAWPSKRMSIE